MKYPVILVIALCFGFAAAKCKYRRGGDWSLCSATGLKSRTDVLKAEKSDANCRPTRNVSKACRDDCDYGRRRLASWGTCDPLSSTIAGTRQLVSGDGCPVQLVEVFDCRIQRRLDRKAARKSQKKALRRAQRRQNKQQNKQERRLKRKQRRQQRRQNRQNANKAN